jgi:hypothetical protein
VEFSAQEKVSVEGIVQSVLFVPQSSAPSFEVLLDVENGSYLNICWQGVRDVAGVQLGTRIHVEGVVIMRNNRDQYFTILNPQYALL